VWQSFLCIFPNLSVGTMATSHTCCHLPDEMLNSAAECADRARISLPSSPSCTACNSTTLGRTRKYLPGRRQQRATSTWTTRHSTGASRRGTSTSATRPRCHAGVTTDVCSSSVAARVQRHKVNVPPMVATGHFIGKENKLHAHGGDGARGHGGLGAVPRQSKVGEAHQRAMVAGNGSRLQSINLKLGDRRKGQGGSQGGDSRGLSPHQRHGMDRRSVQLHPGQATSCKR
jgi:hypothetical protein